MNTASLFSSLSIRSRVMLLATLPIMVLTILLSGYMISSKLSYERFTLVETSRSIIRYLAVGAEFGLFSSNISALSSLSKAALERSDVDDVIFLNKDKNVVYRTSDINIDSIGLDKLDLDRQLEPIYLSPTLWAIHSPVYVSGIDIDDFSESIEGDEPSSPLGWVMLIIDEQELLERQNNILLQGLLITVAALIVTVWLALNIGRSITAPIQGITRTIDKLRHEELNARVDIDSSGELGELQAGINNLAKRVQDTRLRLEDQVEDATLNLRNALSDLERKNLDLDSAKQKAEEANIAKDQFLARMSHELRTPLTSVIGFSQLLQKTPLDPQQHEYSAIVQKTSSLLLNLIDDVLDFSKIQSEAISIEQIEFNLTECLSDVLEMQTPAANAKDIKLYFIPSPDVPETLLGDPTRVRQIVTNLVGNAVKFTEQGSVTVEVSCELKNSKAECVIQVRDTGIGIGETQMEQLFQPFSQGDTTISRRFGGSGLGLVISRHIAQLMNGDLCINSSPHTGTEVSVNIELPIQATGKGRQQRPNCNIIIFEPSELSSRSLGAWADYLGAQHQQVDTSKQLVELLLSTNEIDMLIINVNQEHSQGYCRALVKLIRRHYCGEIVLISDTHSIGITSSVSESCQLLQPIHIVKHPVCLKKITELMVKPVRGASAPSAQQHSTADSNNELKGLKLLVAEDNAFNRLLLERVLTFTGASVTLAPNGERALALASQQQFDCILMDVHMPLMDGIEASRQVRLLGPPFSETPILALTANVIANDVEELKKHGVDTILFKPINEAKIIQEVQKATGTVKRDMDGYVLDKPRRLEDYGITEQELTRELDSQLTAILTGYKEKRPAIMRDHSHQLSGLAGLLELVVLEAAATEFNQAAKTEDWREIWYQLWRLKRVINTLNIYEES